MSQSQFQYLIEQIAIPRIRVLLQNAGISQRNAPLANALVAAVAAPGSNIQNALITWLNQYTNGAWQNGMIPDPQLVEVIRGWVNDTLPRLNQMMASQQQQLHGYQQQQPYPPPQQGYYQNPGMVTPNTASLYDIAAHNTQPPPAAAVITPVAPLIMPEREQSMEVDARPITLRLTPVATLQHTQKTDHVVEVDNYREGEHDNRRVSTIDIKLNTAENIALVAADKALTYAPNEVIRGLYANVVDYKELCHIPMKTDDYAKIIEKIGKVFYAAKGSWDWRAAVDAIGDLKRDEYKALETVLLRFLNPAIFKALRANNGDYIESIDELDDLQELDNPRSTLKVTHHARYLNTFNTIVMRAFDQILNPKHVITSSDQNFGDFVHCSQIEFWSEGRSKYDYGTFAANADKLKFIDQMMEHNTVLRVAKTIIITDALDVKMVDGISYSNGRSMVNLNKTNTVGCSLLLELDQPRTREIEAIICIDKETGTVVNSRQINLGRTLEGDLVLIR